MAIAYLRYEKWRLALVVPDKQRVERVAQPGDPMIVIRYRTRGGGWCEPRMADHRVWKIIKASGAAKPPGC